MTELKKVEIGGMIEGIISSFIMAATTSYGLSAASKVSESTHVLGGLLMSLIVLITISVGYWYAMNNLRSVYLRMWIQFVYEPFKLANMYVIVRTGSDIFFDGSGEWIINKYFEPILLISVIGAIDVIVKTKANQIKELSKV